MMKRIFTIALLFIAATSFAQPDKGGNKDERKERLKAHKVAFISTELNLTTDEAEKFWPVYNELEAKLDKIKFEKRGLLKKMKNFDELSDDEAYEITEKIFNLETEETALRKEYLPKFAEVIGKKKAAKVYLAEERFKRELLKKLKNKDQDNRNGGPGGGRSGGHRGGNGGQNR